MPSAESDRVRLIALSADGCLNDRATEGTKSSSLFPLAGQGEREGEKEESRSHQLI